LLFGTEGEVHTISWFSMAAALVVYRILIKVNEVGG
jgi:hypothetical protein